MQNKGSNTQGRKKFCYLIAGSLTAVCLILRGSSVAYAGDNQITIPNDLKVTCEQIGEVYNICPELLESMAFRESSFRPEVKNGDCWGLMQVNVKIHKDRIKALGYSEEDMLTPEANVTVAADYLSELFEKYEDVAIVLMRYSGNAKKIADYKDNKIDCPYVDDVLTRAAAFERQHGK